MNARLATLTVAVVLGLSASSTVRAQAPAVSSTAAAEARRLQAESERLEAIAGETELKSAPREIDFGAQLLRSFLVLAGVCLFAYLILGKLLPRIMRLTPSGRRAMFGVESRGLVEVIDRLPLEPRRVVYVLKVGDRHLLVGSAEQGMNVLARLSEQDIAAAKLAATKTARTGGIAGGLIGRLSKKEEQS